MKTRVLKNGQISLPASLRRQDSIQAGQQFNVERLSRGKYRLVRQPAGEGELVKWLISCPEKGYFVPIESESTDTL